MLSQTVGYAVAALGCLAAMGGKPALVKELAAACDIPQPYLAKLINLLARHQLVVTQRGVGGGVSLARPPQEITLHEICAALNDPAIQPQCLLGRAACSEDRSCPAHAVCTNQRRELGAFLQSTSIADIAAFETRRRWRAARESKSGPD